MWPCCSCALERTLDVYGLDEVPILIFHVLEADISQNSRIVEEDIDAAEGINGSLDDLVAILDAVIVGYGLATCLLDLIDDDICGL